MIKESVAQFKEKTKNSAFKAVLRLPPDSCIFRFVLVVFTFWTAYLSRKRIANLLKYKKAVNNTEGNIRFLFKCYFRKSYDRIFPHLLAENPGKYLKYVRMEGEEHIKRFKENNTGVIVLSGHFGPAFRTLLFKEVYSMPVSTFVDSSYKIKVCNSPAKLYRINSSFPYYGVGEEKQFREALQRGEWINFLNDVPLMKKRDSQNIAILGQRVFLSELPFKVSVNDNIPILFIGVTLKKLRYTVSALPMDKFDTQKNGLGKYLLLIENVLRADHYSGIYIGENHFKISPSASRQN